MKNKKPTVKVNLTTKGDNYYAIVNVNCNGKRNQKWINLHLSVSGHNKRKADDECKKLFVEWSEKIISLDSEMLFADWLIKWVDTEKGMVEDSTWREKYRQINNIIAPYFRDKGIKLCDLSENDIEDFYKAKMSGEIGKKAVGANTIHHYQAEIHKALKQAVRERLITLNPADFVKLPKKTKHNAFWYSDKQLLAFLDYIKGQEIEVVILLCSWFGLRRGECLGLRWCDIDFDNRTIKIRGVIKDKGESGSKKRNLHYVPKTKSASSMRNLPMPPSSIYFLQQLKQLQDKRKSKNPNYNTKWDEFVCVRPNGDLIPLEYVSRKIPELTIKAGLPRLKCHELRHTNLTLLYEKGASWKELQGWSGDSTVRLLQDTYTHASDKSKEKLANFIDNILTA